jgi:hypothetical protein
LNIRNHNNKIIVPKELKLKNIQKEIRKPIKPKCQFKWDTIYEKKFNWISIWYILNKIKRNQPNLPEMFTGFGADLKSNMAARVHNVFSLAEILKIFCWISDQRQKQKSCI